MKTLLSTQVGHEQADHPYSPDGVEDDQGITALDPHTTNPPLESIA